MRSIKLHKLLSLVGIVPTYRLINPEINNISFNSKDVEKGTLFLGLPGLNVDGGKFWREAIENNAVFFPNFFKRYSNKKVIVVFPFVPVTPISFSFLEGLFQNSATI